MESVYVIIKASNDTIIQGFDAFANYSTAQKVCEDYCALARNPNAFYVKMLTIEEDSMYYNVVSPEDARKAVKIALNQWLDFSEYPKEECPEVIAYNKEWIHPDWCPNGTRIGFLSEEGFISADFNPNDDTYDTCKEEGDDYEILEVGHNTMAKTQYYNNEKGCTVEGHRPNMPTHFIFIPKHP